LRGPGAGTIITLAYELERQHLFLLFLLVIWRVLECLSEKGAWGAENPMGLRSVTFLAVLAAFAGIVSGGCTGPSLRIMPSDALAETIRTEDGWSLVAIRYGVEKDATPSQTHKPVILLVHGLNNNAWLFDVTPEYSLARYLAANGFEVWDVNLRGAGYSTKPFFQYPREIVRILVGGAPLELPRPTLDPRKYDWTCDDYIRYDVPAIIDHAKARTGAERVFWLGHSMGGIIGLVYASGDQQKNLGGVITMGSHLYHATPTNRILQAMSDNIELFKVFHSLINSTLASSIQGMSQSTLEGDFDILYSAPGALRHDIRMRLLYDVTEDIPSGVLSQFFQLVKRGYFYSADGKTNYFDGLSEIRVPTLLVAGKIDNIAEPDSVRRTYEEIGSSDKEYYEAGIANGCSTDYGHVDMILGRNAPKDIYPVVLEWLKAHTGQRTTPAAERR